MPIENYLHRFIFLALVAGLLAHHSYKLVKEFHQLGIQAAHLKTTDGITFSESLKMADGSIDFLGIGADKLTRTAEFETAMIRCASSGRTVRLLLSSPENPLLETLARRNDADPNKYSNNVRESIERISKIKKEKNLNIQIKLYSDEADSDRQAFRLMFINSKICLWSWTMWGSHLGSENPQVVLFNIEEQSQRSAYSAFEAYFVNLWNSPRSIPYDFG